MFDPLESRKDLIKRLFPVAISVGFAAPLIQTGWLTAGRAPTLQEGEQFVRLSLSMFFVLMSGDWFHKDVNNIPPKTLARFLADAAIVFAYMILLILAREERSWIGSIVSIFILYIAWDVIYAVDQGNARLSTLATKYRSAYFGDTSEGDAVPAINVFWLFFFIILLLLPNWLPYPRSP